MWKKFTATILLLAFAANSFSNFIIVIDYYVNSNAFVNNCINKTRPLMHCNGKCQMMKKLQQQEKSDKGNPERKAENKSECISSKSFFASVSQLIVPGLAAYTEIIIQSPVDLSYSLLRPPLHNGLQILF